MPSRSSLGVTLRMASQEVLPSSSQDDLLTASQRSLPGNSDGDMFENSEADALPTNSDDYTMPDNGVVERIVNEMAAVSSNSGEVYPVPTNSETDFVPSNRISDEVPGNSEVDSVTNSEADAFVTNNVDEFLDHFVANEIDTSELPTSSVSTSYQGESMQRAILPSLQDIVDSCYVLSSSDGSLMDED